MRPSEQTHSSKSSARARWHRAELAVGVVLLALSILVIRFGPRVIAYVLWAALLVFIIYALRHIPSRYRIFGPGMLKQASDHRFGIFGRNYSDDPVAPSARSLPGRNDRCPCGSGLKYKQCCLVRDTQAG